LSRTIYIGSVHWSADGKLISAFVLASTAINNTVYTVTTFDLATGAKQSEVPLAINGIPVQDIWSPDGNYLATIRIPHKNVGTRFIASSNLLRCIGASPGIPTNRGNINFYGPTYANKRDLHPYCTLWNNILYVNGARSQTLERYFPSHYADHHWGWPMLDISNLPAGPPSFRLPRFRGAAT
jgi:hypothetical protein